MTQNRNLLAASLIFRITILGIVRDGVAVCGIFPILALPLEDKPCQRSETVLPDKPTQENKANEETQVNNNDHRDSAKKGVEIFRGGGVTREVSSHFLVCN